MYIKTGKVNAAGRMVIYWRDSQTVWLGVAGYKVEMSADEVTRLYRSMVDNNWEELNDREKR